MSRPLPIVALGALALAAGAFGCVHMSEDFVPTERAEAVSPHGYRAAIYDVVMGGEVVGEMRVWSEGAFMENLPGKDRALLHVAFRLESNGPELQIESSHVRVGRVAVDGNVLENLDPTYLEGTTMATLGRDAEAHFYFAVPGPYDPQDLDAFRIGWRVRSSDGKRYVQTTPFLEYEPPTYYGWGYYHSPFYDPFMAPWPYYPTSVIVHPSPFHHRAPARMHRHLR